jgi:hypothetical protein
MILISSTRVTGQRFGAPPPRLLAAGALAADQAWRVIDDYATSIRSGKSGFVHFDPPLRRRKAGSLMPRQPTVIDQDPSRLGQLLLLPRDLAITADEERCVTASASIAPGQVKLHACSGGLAVSRGRSRPPRSSTPTVTDPRSVRAAVAETAKFTWTESCSCAERWVPSISSHAASGSPRAVRW